MNIGMNLDTVIVKATQVRPHAADELDMIRVETHAGEYRFLFTPPEQEVSPISLLGKRLLEAVVDLYGPDQVWHPFWCRCAGCQDVARMEAVYENETAKQWDAWCSR